MGRYRPSQPKSSPYITPRGYTDLQHESEALWKKRRKVTQALAAAAAEGDRSENAEYIYRKKQLRELDRRIRYLQKRLPELVVVDTRPATTEQVFFGATVLLEDESGNRFSYRIVGADEFSPDNNWISVDSPMAKALLKRYVAEEICVQTPSGTREFLILEIIYQ